MRTKSNDSPYRVQVLDRALGILDILAQEGKEMALLELSERVRLHKSTAHRLLRVLERHRLVDRDPESGRYRLGLKLFELGSRALASLDLAGRARPWLKRLVSGTGETAHFSILDRGEALSVANVESPQTIRMPATVGRRVPAYCTAVGKAMIAYLPKEEIDALIVSQGLHAFTRRTITAPAHLRRELEKVRARGWALDDEEYEENLRCVGAPVRDYSGRVVASISIAGPTFRMTRRKIPMLAQKVLDVAARLSTELGAPPAERVVGDGPR